MRKILIAAVLYSGVAVGAECPTTAQSDNGSTILSTSSLPAPTGWRASQRIREWTVFANPSLRSYPDRRGRFIVAVRGLRAKLEQGDQLMFAVPYLCPLGEGSVDNERGFETPVKFYQAVYQERKQ